MLLAAVMAMVLAAAAPAFAQATAVGGNVQYVDCDQVQAAATGQYNTDNQQDMAGIAQELGVSQNQVLACLDSIAAGRDVNINTASASTSTATRPLRLVAAEGHRYGYGWRRRRRWRRWRLRRLRRRLVARSRPRVVHRCWRLALVRCLWVVVFWPAGSFGRN